MLQWQTLVSSYDPKHKIKGTELEQALCGQQSRFAIISVRCYGRDRFSDCRYRIRDAATVSDYDIKEGLRPKIVAEFETLDEAIMFCIAAK